MPCDKPARIASDEELSAIWDMLTDGRDFKPSDVPNLEHQCFNHLIAKRCEEGLMGSSGKLHTLIPDPVTGKPMPHPQVAQHSQAMADIRAMDKALGIACGDEKAKPDRRETPLHVIKTGGARAKHLGASKAG